MVSKIEQKKLVLDKTVFDKRLGAGGGGRGKKPTNNSIHWKKRSKLYNFPNTFQIFFSLNKYQNHKKCSFAPK